MFEKESITISKRERFEKEIQQKLDERRNRSEVKVREIRSSLVRTYKIIKNNVYKGGKIYTRANQEGGLFSKIPKGRREQASKRN